MRAHLLGIALLALCLLGSTAAAPAEARPLKTGILDYEPWYSTESDLAFERTRDAGARVVRIFVSWWFIAPGGDSEQKPEGFNAGDPADPGYSFDGIDQQVRDAIAHGLEPMLLLSAAPVWAEGPGEKPQGIRVRGARDPDPDEYALFAKAVSRRYSGSFQDLPRVRLWQAWNEPNVWANISPQYDERPSQPVPAGAKILSPDIYRRLLNAFADSVHGVHRDNLVVTGGLAPFGSVNAGDHRVAPMVFMRELLCMNSKNKPVRGCKRPEFDVWSHHPYTEGGPTHKALSKDNVSLGDLPRMRKALNAAIRTDRIVSKRRPQFWITEFAWDSKPPEDRGLPLKLHARWAAEAMFQAWRNGVTLFIWFKLRDDDTFGYPDTGVAQSGLYERCADGLFCDKPKPVLTAFRFPFVAYREGRKLEVWGRTPTSKRAFVLIEQQTKNGWRRVARVRSNGDGIFRKRVPRRGKGPARARLAGEKGDESKTLPFSLKRPKDRPAVIL